MKAKDLIKELHKVDPEAEVIIPSSNFELKGNKVPVQFITEHTTGVKQVKPFVDGFDGNHYKTEVWDTFGGELTVITIS